MFRKYKLFQIYELQYHFLRRKIWHNYEPICYLNSIKQIKTALLDLLLGRGLGWTSPPRDIIMSYTHVAIYKLTATVRKGDALKNLLLLCELHCIMWITKYSSEESAKILERRWRTSFQGYYCHTWQNIFSLRKHNPKH